MPSQIRVHIALLAVAILFSLNYIISKLAMHAFHPMTFAYLRVVGSAIVLSAILPRDREEPSPEDRRQLFGLSLLGVVFNQTLFLGGLSLSNAHIAAILITSIPVFTLAAAIVLRRERGSPAKLGGIALAAAGALSVVGIEGFVGSSRALAGAMLIVINSLCYALYLVLSKPLMARLTARYVIARMFTYGTVAMLPIAGVPILRERWTAIPAGAWIALLLVIAGPTVAAYLINGWALRHADSSLVAAYTYVQPFLTALLAAVYLHEHIRPVVGVAAAMIFAGIYLSGRPAPPAAREEAIPGCAD